MAEQVDNGFERAFADLAYAQLKDKAPQLLDYMIGFQVIDKNDDDTQAAGVFGFKVGKQWFYAPMFFLGGELKGGDLLYIKSQDIFVPLQENWVSYIISRRPNILGEGTESTPAQLGIMNPDFRSYINSPLRGWHKTAVMANYDPDREEERNGYWVRGDVFDITPMLCALSKSPNDPTYKEAAARMDLSKAVPDLGTKAAAIIARTAMVNPSFKQAITKYYSGKELLPSDVKQASHGAIRYPSEYAIKQAGMDRGLFNYHVNDLVKRGLTKQSGSKLAVIRILQDHGISSISELKDNAYTILEAPQMPKVAAPIKQKAEIITRKDIVNSAPSDITDEERTEAMSEGFIVRDARADEEKSKIYDINVVDQFSNPEQTGLYTVVDKRGKSHEVLILINPKTIGTGSALAAFILSKDGKEYGKTVRSAIFVRSDMCTSWQPFLADLKDVDSMEEGKAYVICSPDGVTSMPFRVAKKEDDSYMVDPMSGCTIRGAGSCDCFESSYNMGMTNTYRQQKYPEIEHKYDSVSMREPRDDSDYDRKIWSARPLLITRRAGTLKSVGDTLMVPDGCKVFPVDYEAKELSYTPANLSDIEQLYIKSSSLEPVRMWSDGINYQIESGVLGGRMDKLAAVSFLVNDLGISAEASRIMLSRTDEKGSDSFHIKRAAPAGGPLTPGPAGPSTSVLDNNKTYDPRLQATLDEGGSIFQNVNMPYATQADYDPYNRGTDSVKPIDTQAATTAAEAAKNGQKDVMDISVLGSLVKIMDVEPTVNKYTSDLIKGEDRLGRILMLYYWHNDKFSERYGDDEMQELESVLRDTFKSLGDLILFLKKRGLEPDVSMQGADVSLDQLST